MHRSLKCFKSLMVAGIFATVHPHDELVLSFPNILFSTLSTRYPIDHINALSIRIPFLATCLLSRSLDILYHMYGLASIKPTKENFEVLGRLKTILPFVGRLTFDDLQI